ncbi:Gfo/Idh/MocA family oxidoreductase [Actinomadura madurae]|uniref:Predicted dehydrogenase n=1 Tax=Actinomadura madurae TaxID=1993 RepID=A0A1I5NAM2_9ACTN|nr:Gfo/Idh/MocA family oxidoreductase [Actinomadura madurae]SFP18271.1 Predicted dehydrogenase [Actinomadura madurae]SPT50247.1 1,5-anhydro-D-fructose reductase [Actinomadura madurae]
MESDSVPMPTLVVGTGFIAAQHAAAIHAEPRLALAGVVDIDPGRAAAASRANDGVPWFTDLAAALAESGASGCVVCTPNDTHADLTVQIAEAGAHLLIEKPLAVDVAGARRAVEAFAAAGRVLMPAHSHRHYDYARTVRDVVRSGELGTVELVRLSILGGWIWPDWRGWMLDPARSGGHALHNGVHLLDLVTWWTGGTPETVYARGRRQTAAELGIHDYLEMTVGFADGTAAVCEMSRGHRPASFARRDVMVAGTGGILTIPWDAEAGTVTDESGTALLPPGGTDGFAAQIAAWADAVTGAPPAVTGADGLLAVAMGVAAERSIASGLPVRVTDVLKEAP